MVKVLALHACFLISSFFETQFRIKTSVKNDVSISLKSFQVVEKANEMYIYKYKLGHGMSNDKICKYKR